MTKRTEGDAALFGIAYLGVKDIYSADNSSPQTTEINAAMRAPTLMKWVNVAAVESLAVVWLLGLTAPPGHKRWPLFGGILALAVTYCQYIHARDTGLQQGGKPTETYAQTANAASGRYANAPGAGS